MKSKEDLLRKPSSAESGRVGGGAPPFPSREVRVEVLIDIRDLLKSIDETLRRGIQVHNQ